MKAYRGNILFTPTHAHFEVIANGYVLVNDMGIIEGVYPSDYLPYSDSTEIIDFGDKLLIPAMNDMHVHAPQYNNMGVAMDMELIPWLNTYTFPEESKFCDEEYALRVYSNFVSELCRQGTMRASVFSTIHLPATKCLAKIFADTGMGALIGLVGMDRNSPEELKNTTQSWKDDIQSLIQYVSRFPLINPIVTPRFLPSCTPKMLQTMGEIAQAYNLPVQSHLSENKKEIQWVRELEPQSTCYGDAYNRYGLFGQTPTLMAHCCYSDGEELQLLRDNGVYVVHCPTSNCNLASGIAPIRRFLQAGIPVVLGSDIAAGHHLSIFCVMQYAVQMSKLQYALTDGKYPFLTLSEVFYMATKAGGAFFGKVGSFEKGYAFDALVIDDQSLSHDTLNTASLIHRLERFIYMGDDRHIAYRFCQGKQITIS